MRQPLREVVMLEVNVFQHFVIENAEEIYREVNQGFDISKWWGQHHEKFPKLSHVVKKVLCIPATSANCERAFSTLTDVVTKKRNRLHGKTTVKLTFCKHNMNLIPDYTTNRKPSTSETENISDIQDETEDTSDIDDWS